MLLYCRSARGGAFKRILSRDIGWAAYENHVAPSFTSVTSSPIGPKRSAAANSADASDSHDLCDRKECVHDVHSDLTAYVGLCDHYCGTTRGKGSRAGEHTGNSQLRNGQKLEQHNRQDRRRLRGTESLHRKRDCVPEWCRRKAQVQMEGQTQTAVSRYQKAN